MILLTYRPSPTSPAITLELADAHWDRLHERLVANGMCAARDERLEAIVRRQRQAMVGGRRGSA